LQNRFKLDLIKGLCGVGLVQVIHRIDDDVELALADVEAGHADLLKFHSIISGNRGVILKVFAILIIFIILFVRYF
jgi:syntaxin 5